MEVVPLTEDSHRPCNALKSLGTSPLLRSHHKRVNFVIHYFQRLRLWQKTHADLAMLMEDSHDIMVLAGNLCALGVRLRCVVIITEGHQPNVSPMLTGT